MTGVSPWIPVGQLEQAFSPKSHKLPPTTDLVGKDLVFYLQNGLTIQHRFETADRLRLSLVPGSGKWIEESYHATKIRDEIYFLDYMRHLERGTSASFVLDFKNGILTSVVGELPTQTEAVEDFRSRIRQGKELTSVRATIQSGSIGKPFDDSKKALHAPTEDLVGKRVEFKYSNTEMYEHIYLNKRFFTWHSLAGVEKNLGELADTDRCHHYKIADKLYLFIWREKIIPTLGVMVADYQRMQTSGKIMGYQSDDFQKITNFQTGAKIRILQDLARS